jgi:hypothetical protein
LIAHIVLLRMREAVAEDVMRSFAQSLCRACDEIPAVRHARAGPRIYVDPGYERSLGDSTYEFAAVLEFDDEGGLREYLTHPLHGELGKQFWDLCDSTVIFEGSLRDLKGASPGHDWVTSLIPRKP